MCPRVRHSANAACMHVCECKIHSINKSHTLLYDVGTSEREIADMCECGCAQLRRVKGEHARGGVVLIEAAQIRISRQLAVEREEEERILPHNRDEACHQDLFAGSNATGTKPDTTL
jgi:hypothetical protein